MPSIRAQNDLLRAADLGDLLASAFFTGGFKFPPVALLYEARPLAFNPPLGFLPAFRCHAGDLAIYRFLPLFMYERAGVLRGFNRAASPRGFLRMYSALA